MSAVLLFEGQRIEPAEMRRRVALVAGGLDALGVREGDVVALVLRNQPAAIEVTLACNELGAYHCPINWHFKSAELAYVLGDSGAKVLFIQSDLLAAVADAIPSGVAVIAVAEAGVASPSGADVPAYAEWQRQQTPFDGAKRTPLGRFAYTSGTTGRPKGVRRLPQTLDPEQPLLLEQVARLGFGFERDARAYMPAPLYHGAPNLYAIQAMERTALLVLASRFDAEETLRAIERHRISHLYLVPTMCVRLLALPAQTRARYDLSSLQFAISTGSPFATDVKRAMIAWWGPVIHESYASSEFGLCTVIGSKEWLARPGSVGRAFGRAEIRIVGDDGRELGAGEVGNIHVRQPAYADFTYHNQPQARQAIDHHGLACVGDIGYLDADGYLYICDRKSDMVISGGVNIYPAETEAVLGGMPGVADCVAFGVPDPEFGESLMAVVQTEPGIALTSEAVQAWLKIRIASQKVPKRIEFRNSLPRDDSGKLMKRRVREPYWSQAGRSI